MIYEYEKENAEINADNTEYELKYYEQMLKKTSQSDSKYYELCNLEKQTDVQRVNVDYLKKYAEIETIKLESGQATETERKLAQINLQMAENELSSAEKSVQNKTREISDFMNPEI